jgi:hypothetical protein
LAWSISNNGRIGGRELEMNRLMLDKSTSWPPRFWASGSEEKEAEYRAREALLDRLLNDPGVPLDSQGVWVLLDEMTGMAIEGKT